MIKRHLKLKTNIGYRVVEHNQVLYFSGIVADDLMEGMSEQTLQICRKMKQALDEVGSSIDKVLTATIFLSDFQRKEEMSRVWVEWFKDADLPARSTIGVSDLGPGVLLEVVITAAA